MDLPLVKVPKKHLRDRAGLSSVIQVCVFKTKDYRVNSMRKAKFKLRPNEVVEQFAYPFSHEKRQGKVFFVCSELNLLQVQKHSCRTIIVISTIRCNGRLDICLFGTLYRNQGLSSVQVTNSSLQLKT